MKTTKVKGRKAILVRNTKYGAMLTILQYVLQFALRTVMIYCLGVEFLGIGGLFTNIIGCLGLVELGMGAAVVYSMYKPVAENDIEKIKSLHRLYKRIYYTIAVIITVLGLALLPVLPYLIKSGIPNGINIYAVYLVFLFNTGISYLTAHKRSLIIVHQRNDVESKIRMSGLLLLYIFQIGILLVAKNYYLYLICMPICTILEGVIVYTVAKKMFPQIRGKSNPIDSVTKKEIIRNITASSMHQLGGVLVLSTDNIIISSILGLVTLGVYSNYSVIITCITACVTLITTTAQSSLGNLVATESTEYVYKRYNVFNFIMSWLVGFCAICLLCLLNPFILIWAGSEEFLLGIGVVIVLVLNFYISNSLSLTNVLNVSAGLIWYSRWKPLIQGITNIVTSLILTHYFGLIGVFLGTLISYLIMPIWIEGFILFKHYFKKGLLGYLKKYLLYFVVFLFAGAVTYFLTMLISGMGVLSFVLKFIISLIVPNLIFLAALFWTSEFKESFKIGKSLILSVFKKKQQAIEVSASEEKDVFVSGVDVDLDGVADLQVVAPKDEKE